MSAAAAAVAAAGRRLWRIAGRALGARLIVRWEEDQPAVER
jgi:hypothetical protein